MILETAQMLSVAYHHYFPTNIKFNTNETMGGVILYKVSHINHPCNVWIRKHPKHFIWTVELFQSLAHEKYYRTNKWHLSYIKLWQVFSSAAISLSMKHKYSISQKHLLNSADFTFDCSKVIDREANIFDKYKACLAIKWRKDRRKPKWTNRTPPTWFTGEE
jgi:hypothetical protein